MYAFTLLYLTLFLVCESYRGHKAVITHPTGGPFLAIVSDYSCKIDDCDLELQTPIVGKLIYHLSDSEGCTKWQAIETNELQSIGIVDRGTCTFLEKTEQAQLAGLDIILIVSEDESMTPMGADEKALSEYSNANQNNIILSFMVPQSFKMFMLSLSQNDEQIIEINAYNTGNKIWDISMLIMIFLSTILVAAGAYYSSDIERAKMYQMSNNNNKNGLRRRAPIQEISKQMAWSFIIIASFGLLTMYFFVSKIFIVIVIIFCIGATNGLSTIFAHLIDYFIPSLQNIEYYIKQIDLQFTLSDIFGFIPAVILTVVWYLVRSYSNFAWMLQNIMCIGLLLTLQRTIRLTNLKIACILLGTAFLYDIFWVFISPLIFESSVMVSVATYEHNQNSKDTLPVVLKIPRIDDIFHSPMILGLGDIALPGLLISYLLRYDYINRIGIKNLTHNLKNGYFLISVIGYAFGMLLTDINLILMQSGQPALLFLVPCTLGVIAAVAYKRGQVKQIWNGVSIQYIKPTKSQEFLLKS